MADFMILQDVDKALYLGVSCCYENWFVMCFTVLLNNKPLTLWRVYTAHVW